MDTGHFGLVLQITSAISPRDDHVFAFHAMRAAPVCGLQLASTIETDNSRPHARGRPHKQLVMAHVFDVYTRDDEIAATYAAALECTAL